MTEDVKQLDWEHADADQYYLVVRGKNTGKLISHSWLSVFTKSDLQQLAISTRGMDVEWGATADELYEFFVATAEEFRRITGPQNDTWHGHFTVSMSLQSSPYYTHAIKEFDAAYPLVDMEKDTYDMQQAILQNVMEMLETFEKQGHSGFSMSYMLGVFNRVVYFKSLTEKE